MISPLFNQLPTKYPKAIFLKVDVDKCTELAAASGVSAMPTFVFYRSKQKIDRLQGADIQGLEQKIKQHYGVAEVSGEEEKDYGPGLMDLTPMIMKNNCECLNEHDEHTLEHCLNPEGGYLASDCDEQLIIRIAFNQAVKIHSIQMKAPLQNAPKKIKIFINQPVTFDFDQASAALAIQEIECTPKDFEGDSLIALRFVKFQNIQNIMLFVDNNLTGNDRTIIEQLKFIGAPVITTKMDDFKRIGGKKGESH